MSLRVVISGCLLVFAVSGCGDEQRPFPGTGEGGAAGSPSGAGGEEEPAGSSGAGGDDGAQGGSSSGSERPTPLECTEVQRFDVGDELFTGMTSDAEDDFDASCFSGNAEDLAVEWIAPKSDYYRFTTAGSDYDTALALLDGACDGTELACNADSSEPQVEIVTFVEKGKRVVVVLDGKAGASGEVVFGVEAIKCPALDLTDEVLPIELGTQNQGDNSAACGGDGKSDRALRFVPPEDGLYRFSARSDDFGAIVSIEEGPVCGGALLGCGYSFRDGEPGQVVRELEAGEPVTVFVDGGSGTFELDIEEVSTDASCPADGPAILLDGGLPHVVGSFDTATHLLSGSCAPTGDFDGTAAYVPLVERSFPLSVNLPPDMSCQLNIVSAASLAVYLLEGDRCAGPELECATTSPNVSTSLSFDSSENGDYVLVVEDLDGIGEGFEIDAACII